MNSQRILILEGSDLPKLPTAEGLADPATCSAPQEQADARVVITGETGEIVAHAALWWSEAPPMDGHQPGAIGGYAAVDEASSSELLDAACDHLRKQGRSIAVGPMNGNTWRRYRFVTESNGRAPFLLEPTNPEAYPLWWQAAGFTDLSHYSSSLMPLPCEPATSPRIRERLKESGISVRELDTTRYEEELTAIYEVSIRSFSNNFLYTPLEKNSFIQSYNKVRDHVDPRFVRIAEKDGQVSGFVFGIPDLNALARGEKPALIVKTLAVDPGSRCAGLGSLLVDAIQEAATAAGYSEAIHALQHETNTSLKITKRNAGKKFRQYTLYQKTL